MATLSSGSVRSPTSFIELLAHSSFKMTCGGLIFVFVLILWGGILSLSTQAAVISSHSRSKATERQALQRHDEGDTRRPNDQPNTARPAALQPVDPELPGCCQSGQCCAPNE